MNYYKKYKKYKSKYFSLKNQKGGDFPQINIIKNINIFPLDSDMEKLLNPIHGFIYYETSVIENLYKFSVPDDSILNEIIKDNFNEIEYVVRPNKNILDDKIKIEDLGLAIGFLYCYKKYDIENKLKDIKRIQFNLKNKINENKKKGIINLEENSQNEKLLNIIKTFENYPFINKHIKKMFNKIIKSDLKDMYFYVLLVFVWWKADNKRGIKKYYEGVICILRLVKNLFGVEIENLIIPSDFEDDVFTYSELLDYRTNDYYQALAVSYIIKNNFIKIYNYSTATVNGIQFPNCGETMLRNFINIILCDSPEKINTEILGDLEAIDELKEYYKVFNTLKIQSSSDTYDIFGKKLNSIDAFAYVVSNIPNVAYRGDGFNIKGGLNIKDDKSNMLEVINFLFKKISTWTDFVSEFEKIGIELKMDVNIDTDGLGYINIKNKNGEYKFMFTSRHYNTMIINRNITTDFTDLTEEQNLTTLLIQQEAPINIKTFLHIKYYESLLITLFESEVFSWNVEENVIPEKYYSLIFNFIKTKYDKENLKIDIGRENMDNYDLSDYGVFYDESGNKKYENIIKITNCCTSNLEKCINLKEVVYNDSFNVNVKLPNSITTLIFGDSFDKYIENFPNSIEFLVFGKGFDQPIGNLPPTLNYLMFGSDFNQNIDNLPRRLKCLILGDSFNTEIKNLPFLLKVFVVSNNTDRFNYRLGDITTIVDLHMIIMEQRLDFKEEMNLLTYVIDKYDLR
jgi:hypothetical protein